MIHKTDTISTINSNTIGVLTDSEVQMISVVQGKRTLRSVLLPADASEPGGLLAFLWQAGLTSVWVMPGTTLSRTATCGWFEQASPYWVVVTHPDPREPARPHCAFLWPKGGGQREARRLAFVFPERIGWDWVLPDAKSLLATVTYLDQVLAKHLIDSPDLIAHQLLTDLTQDQPLTRLRALPTELYTLLRGGETPSSVIEKNTRDLSLPLPANNSLPLPTNNSLPLPANKMWMRPLTLAEQRQRYLHKYVHLSRCLEACMAVPLGVGEATYSSNGRAYDGMRPGLWRVYAEPAGSIFDGKHLPRCLSDEWMSTPQVKCCQDISYQVSVREGYYWPQSYEPLTLWAKTLWQAAERLHTHPQSYRHGQGRANAFQTIKQLAQRGIAILAEDEQRGGWARLDWWTQIVGRSRAMLFTHLAGFARKGTMPVLVDGDALWVVSDDPNPLTAVRGLVTVQRWKGYLVGYEVPLPLSHEVKAVFRTVEHPDQVAMALDTLAGEVFP